MSEEQSNGFYQIDNSLLREYGAQIGAYGVAIYNVLAMYANGNGDGIYPAYQTIADQLGISRRKVIATIDQLCSLGLVRKEARKGVSGKTTSNAYQLPKHRGARHAPVHDVHHASAHGAPSGVHDVHHASAHGAPNKDPIEQYPIDQDPIEKEGGVLARETDDLPTAVNAPPPFQRRPAVNGIVPPPQTPHYRNGERKRAAMNVEIAARAGMNAGKLREWADWVLEQAGQLAIADVDEFSDERIGKAQQTAINLWKLGFNTREQLDHLIDWLSYLAPPYYAKNLETAASAIVEGLGPPGKRRVEAPVSIQSLYNVAMREQGAVCQS